MCSATESSRQIAAVALLFESGLVVLAVVVAQLLGRWPMPGVKLGAAGWEDQAWAAAWGLLAALPMFLGLLVLDRFPIGPLRGLQQVVAEKVAPLLCAWTVPEMLTISLAAGLGEEMLFRGLLQTALAENIDGVQGIVIALVTASVIFGLCHWITPSYAVLAGLMGAYLGALLLLTGNLLTPIVTHAVYDFGALLYLTRPNSRDHAV